MINNGVNSTTKDNAMSNEATESRLLTKQKAAQYLNISEWSIYHLKRTKQIACCMIAGKLMFRIADLDDYIERHRIAAAGCE